MSATNEAPRPPGVSLFVAGEILKSGRTGKRSNVSLGHKSFAYRTHFKMETAFEYAALFHVTQICAIVGAPTCAADTRRHFRVAGARYLRPLATTVTGFCARA